MHSFRNRYKDKKLIVGVGSALIDILAHEDEDFLNKTGAVKGGMTYVDKEFIDDTLSLASQRPALVPGGSACNTVVGIGKLGGAALKLGRRILRRIVLQMPPLSTSRATCYSIRI